MAILLHNAQSIAFRVGYVPKIPEIMGHGKENATNASKLFTSEFTLLAIVYLALALVVQHWKSVHKFPRQVHNICKDHTQVYEVDLQSLTLRPTHSINVPPVSPVPPSPYPHSPPPFQPAPQLVRQYRLLLVVRSSLRSLPVCPRVSNQIPWENPPETRLKRRKHTFISLIPS